MAMELLSEQMEQNNLNCTEKIITTFKRISIMKPVYSALTAIHQTICTVTETFTASVSRKLKSNAQTAMEILKNILILKRQEAIL